MSDLRLDEETGDLAVDAGLSIVEDDENLRQRLLLRLQMVLGEWFLDRTAGTDYYGQIFGRNKSFGMTQVDAELVRVILSTNGVDRFIDPLTYNFSDRVLQVEFSVLSALTGEEVAIETTLTVGE